MKKEEEKANSGTSAKTMLADTPERRMKQYDEAMQTINRFENHYKTYEEGLTKVTEWTYERGTIRKIIEEFSQKEKDQLELAREIVEEYEENHMQEYFDLSLPPFDIEEPGDRQAATPASAPEKATGQSPRADEQRALEEIAAVRAEKHQPDRNRVADFDKNTKDRPLSEIPMQTQINVIHPDGATAMPITSAQEFVDGFLATYSDKHGDFGLYDVPEEADIAADDERMQREFEYIMEMQERAGIEFNDYDEAVEWERNEYGDGDISQDDQFDIERW